MYSTGYCLHVVTVSGWGPGLAAISKRLIDNIKANKYIDFMELHLARRKSRTIAHAMEVQILVVQAADPTQIRISSLTWQHTTVTLVALPSCSWLFFFLFFFAAAAFKERRPSADSSSAACSSLLSSGRRQQLEHHNAICCFSVLPLLPYCSAYYCYYYFFGTVDPERPTVGVKIWDKFHSL